MLPEYFRGDGKTGGEHGPDTRYAPLRKAFFDRPSVVNIIRNFEDRIYEDKIHGSGKNGNRFLLHY